MYVSEYTWQMLMQNSGAKLCSLCSRFCDRCMFYLSILQCSRMIILHVVVRAPRSYKHSHGQNEVRLLHIPFLWYSSRRKNIWHNRHEVILLVLNIVFYFCHMWKVPCVINVKSPCIAPNFLKILPLVQAAEAGGTQTIACALSHKSTQRLVSSFGCKGMNLRQQTREENYNQT